MGNKIATTTTVSRMRKNLAKLIMELDPLKAAGQWPENNPRQKIGKKPCPNNLKQAN